MSLSPQQRNTIIGAVAAVVIVAALAFLLGRGCAEEEKPATTVRTATATVPVETVAVPPVTVTVPVEPEPEPVPPPVTLPDIVSRSVDPAVVSPGDAMTFTADVSGTATSVTMTVYKMDTGTLAMTLPLIEGATVGNVTTWSAGAAAPAVTGDYRYFASAVATDGSVVEMPGISAWTFTVEP